MAVKRMYLLPCGVVNADRSILLTGIDIGQKIKSPVISVLLMHEDGPILIDTGLNPDGLTNPETTWGPRAKLIKPELTESDDIRKRLNEVGLRISVLIRLASGAFFIFADDVISLEDNLTYKIPGSNTWSAQQSTDSIYRLEHLSQLLPAQIIPPTISENGLG